MRVGEIMSDDVVLVRRDQTLQEAARLMAEADAGALPVIDGGKLIGMITDRDITVRAVAQGKGPHRFVDEVMTREAQACYEDDDTVDVARHMAEIQVRRMPVLSRDQRLVGIISLADLATLDGPLSASVAIEGVSTPGGQHRQEKLDS
jgi:CBS domain-containing protein